VIHPNPNDPIQFSVAGLKRFLLNLDAPNLRTLEIKDTPFSDHLTQILAESSILSQLHRLDLSSDTLTELGAQQLIANKARYQHLDLLILESRRLSSASSDLYSLGCPVKLTGSPS
jgi:hypothetical protein